MNPLDAIISFLVKNDELNTANQLLHTFEKYSSQIDQFDQLGRLYNEVKNFPKAIDCAGKTLALSQNPHQMYSSRSNLAKMYNHVNNPDKALQYINTNLIITPDDYESKMEKVFSLYLKGNLTESYQLTKELLNDSNTPDHVRNRCLFNSGSYQIDEGNFKEGIRNFIDVGHRIGIWNNRQLPNPWTGEVIPNANIVIIAEGGIGDELINVRFMEDIKALGMNPIWVSNHKLSSLFNRNGFTSVDDTSLIPQDSYFCYSFYLPILLDLDKNQLDRGVYLKPDQEYIEKWKKILPEGKKVALRWAGNNLYEQSLHRHIDLKTYMDTFGDKDVKFISVQRDSNMEELKTYPEVFDASQYLETYEDLLACLFLCDKTISSCTSVAHFAAASGCNLTALPPIACYYVWLGSGNDWYGHHVKVIRQRNHNDWSIVNEVEI